MSSQHIYMLTHCVHLLEILQKDEIESSPQEFNNINAKNQKLFLKGSLDIVGRTCGRVRIYNYNSLTLEEK